MAGPSATALDIEAEHDPDVSRRASNAALKRSAVQMKGAGGAQESAHDAARRGVESPTTAMPHAAAIQQSFGAHDISHLQAHVGGSSAAAMGAQAYATGNHVVFDKQPDLHTAAHEAAHVVQQARGVNLYGGVGEAGDSYERHADEVADRVVQGKSAEDLLGAPTQGHASGGVVQQKGPSQGDADAHLIAAFEAHVKLTAARMHAGAEQVRLHLKMPTNTAAAQAPMMMAIDHEVAAVNDALDNLSSEVSRVSSVLGRTITDELGTIQSAFHASWAPALNSVYSATHDADGNLYTFAQGYDLTVGTAQTKMRSLYRSAGTDEAHVGNIQAPRIADPAQAAEQRDEELKAAEFAALSEGMSAIEAALALVKADLHSSMPDLSKETIDLRMAVEQLVAVLEPIDPTHIGKVKKLPILIDEVQALQAEVMKMKDAGDDKGKALAPQIGYNTQLSTNLFKLKTKLKSLAPPSKKH